MTMMIEESPQASAPRRGRRLPRWAAPLGVLVILTGAFATYTLAGRSSSTKPPAGAISEATMEDRYGVRVDLVALTALGGLAQLRFTVLDKDKADKLFHTDKPKLLVESNGTLLSPPEDAAHKMTLLNGAGYFLFYANAGDVLHAGDKVSVVVEGVRLEHVVVKS